MHGAKTIHRLISVQWGTTALVPFVILAHSNFRGASAGWVHASLTPGDELYAWTVNRLALWLLLFLAGVLCILRARRTDPHGDRCVEFARSRVGSVCLVALVPTLLLLLAIFEPSSVALVCMLLQVLLLAAWGFSRTGATMRRAVGRGLLIAGSLAALFALGELALRLPPIEAAIGGSLEARGRQWNRTDMRAVTASNTLGLRSPHIGTDKPGNALRILALGDSFTAGDWLDRTTETWPHVTESVLVARGHQVQCVNAGRGGTTTEDEAKFLRDVGWGLQPDVVVLQFTLNDTGFGTAGSPPLVPILGDGLRRKSSLYSFLEDRWQALLASRTPGSGLADWYRDDHPGWRATAAAIDDIVQQARRRSIPLVALIYPWLAGPLAPGRYAHQEVHDKIRHAFARHGVPVLDVLPALAARHPEGRHFWVRPFDAHPNAEAHRIAGEALAEFLLRERVLESRRSRRRTRPDRGRRACLGPGAVRGPRDSVRAAPWSGRPPQSNRTTGTTPACTVPSGSLRLCRL